MNSYTVGFGTLIILQYWPVLGAIIGLSCTQGIVIRCCVQYMLADMQEVNIQLKCVIFVF